MYKTLLINELNTADVSDDEVEVFFLIGKMNDVRDKLMDLLNSCESDYCGKCLFKYNGFVISLAIKNIPVVLKFLTDNGIEIFGVYGLYDPDFN